MKKSKIKFILISIFISLVIFLTGFTFWGNIIVKATVFNIKDENLPDGFIGYKIAQISDLHNAELGKDNSKIIKILEKQKPDLIVITGDIVDSSHTDVDTAVTFVKNISEIAPVYYVAGNHEAWLDSSEISFSSLKMLLEEAGACVLDNETKIIERNEDKINLIGINDPSFEGNEMMSPDEGIISSYIETARAGMGYSILLSHRPELFDIYKEKHINVVFSGHAHGGQFRLPFVGGLVAPNQGLFPKYDGGVYKEADTTMIVSRGLGNSIIPFRFNNCPEVVIVELTK